MKLYTDINRLLRSLTYKAWDGIDTEQYSDGYATGVIQDYIRRDIRELSRIWPSDVPTPEFQKILDLAKQGTAGSFREIVTDELPKLEDAADNLFGSRADQNLKANISLLLHPAVTASSLSHFSAGHYREAVVNSVIAVFDLLRWKSHLDKDGQQLVTETLALERPRVELADLNTESGRNVQKGFIEMLKGIYLGVRNPGAHTLSSDLDEKSAAQYLVFASLLADKVDSGRKVNPAPNDAT